MSETESRLKAELSGTGEGRNLRLSSRNRWASRSFATRNWCENCWRGCSWRHLEGVQAARLACWWRDVLGGQLSLRKQLFVGACKGTLARLGERLGSIEWRGKEVFWKLGFTGNWYLPVLRLACEVRTMIESSSVTVVIKLCFPKVAAGITRLWPI